MSNNLMHNLLIIQSYNDIAFGAFQRKWTEFENDAKTEASVMHSKDPTGKLGERLPKVYEDYIRFIEKSSKGMSAMERKRNTAVENHCLSPMAPLGSNPQARPRSEVASENRASSTNRSTNANNNNATVSGGTTLEEDTANHPSSLARGAELSLSSLPSTSTGKKRKPTKKTSNRKQVCTRDRTQDFMKEAEGRNKMHEAMTAFIQKSSMRTTMEIIDDYEKMSDKYDNATGRKKKVYKCALDRLENEMKMAGMGDNEINDSDSDSDSDY